MFFAGKKFGKGIGAMNNDALPFSDKFLTNIPPMTLS